MQEIPVAACYLGWQQVTWLCWPFRLTLMVQKSSQRWASVSYTGVNENLAHEKYDVAGQLKAFIESGRKYSCLWNLLNRAN